MVFIALAAAKAAKMAREQHVKKQKRNAVIVPCEGSMETMEDRASAGASVVGRGADTWYGAPRQCEVSMPEGCEGAVGLGRIGSDTDSSGALPAHRRSVSLSSGSEFGSGRIVRERRERKEDGADGHRDVGSDRDGGGRDAGRERGVEAVDEGRDVKREREIDQKDEAERKVAVSRREAKPRAKPPRKPAAVEGSFEAAVRSEGKMKVETKHEAVLIEGKEREVGAAKDGVGLVGSFEAAARSAGKKTAEVGALSGGSERDMKGSAGVINRAVKGSADRKDKEERGIAGSFEQAVRVEQRRRRAVKKGAEGGALSDGNETDSKEKSVDEMDAPLQNGARKEKKGEGVAGSFEAALMKRASSRPAATVKAKAESDGSFAAAIKKGSARSDKAALSSGEGEVALGSAMKKQGSLRRKQSVANRTVGQENVTGEEVGSALVGTSCMRAEGSMKKRMSRRI